MKRYSQPPRGLALFLGASSIIISFTLSFCPTLYASPSNCATCHANQVALYRATAMGQSLISPDPLAPGEITHQISHSKITVEYRDHQMFHSISENALTAEYPIHYQVGGKLMGSSFLVQIGDYLFESPASWYRSYGWDISPGYESARAIDFDRPMNDACLFCHAGVVHFADADGRRLGGQTLEAITCERCHGSGEEHARHPSAKNIVNPARLAGAKRASICEQCHLEAAGRILNPGKSWEDFKPGESTEQTYATYILTGAGNKEVIAVSQVEQFTQSQCARKSGNKLWCGTCHNPHGETADAKDRPQQLRKICASCHSKLSPAAHPAAQRECTSCHMPSTPTTNVTHAALTDHRILRRPSDSKTSQQQIAPPNIHAWREPSPDFRERDLALAELLAAVSKNQPALQQQGSDRLAAMPEWQKNNDFDVLTALEGLSLQQGNLPAAAELGHRTVELRPQSAKAAMNLGIVFQRSGETADAEVQFKRAIELDASLKPAYQRLAILYGSEGRTQEMMDIINRFLKWNPQDIMFRIQKLQHQQQTPGPNSGPN